MIPQAFKKKIWTRNLRSLHKPLQRRKPYSLVKKKESIKDNAIPK